MSNPPPPPGFECQADLGEDTALDPAFILKLTRELLPAQQASQQKAELLPSEAGQDFGKAPENLQEQEPDKQVAIFLVEYCLSSVTCMQHGIYPEAICTIELTLQAASILPLVADCHC